MICGFENCNEESEKRCGRCSVVYYCSKDHQQQDWGNHRRVCGSFTVKRRENEDWAGEDNGNHGNVPIGSEYCEAGRDLDIGSVVVEESPIFQLPCVAVSVSVSVSADGATMEEAGKGGGFRPCVSCGVNNVRASCTGCQWPVCGPKCQNSKVHAENECGVFRAKGIHFNDLDVEESLEVLGINRIAGVKAKSSEGWKDLLNVIEFDQAQENQGKNVDEAFKEILGKIKKKSIYLENRQLEEDRQNLNTGAGSSGPKFRDIYQSGLFLYRVTSKFTHSCRPNCSWNLETPAFGNVDDNLISKIRVQTVRPIKKGELLTVSHLDDFGGIISKVRQGTWERSLLLYKNNPHRFRSGSGSDIFICQCSRCKSPSELDSFSSAIFCPDCPEQFNKKANKRVLLPAQGSGFGSMRCQKCQKTSNISIFKKQLEDIQKRLLQADGTGHEPFYEIIKENQESLLLHPNHWLMTAAYSGFIQEMAANRQPYIQAGVAVSGKQLLASRGKPDFQKLSFEYIEQLVKLDAIIFGDVWSQKKVYWKHFWATRIIKNVQNCTSSGALEFGDFAKFRGQLDQAMKWLEEGISFHSKTRGGSEKVEAMERMVRVARDLQNAVGGARQVQNEMLSRFNLFGM